MALRFRTLDFRTIDGSNNNLAVPAMNRPTPTLLGWVRRISPMGSMK
jgi:hypothetical protein